MLRNSSCGRSLFKVVFSNPEREIWSIFRQRAALRVIRAHFISRCFTETGICLQKSLLWSTTNAGGVSLDYWSISPAEEKKIFKWWSALQDKTRVIRHSLSWISRCPAVICRMRLWFLLGGYCISTWGRHSTDVAVFPFASHLFLLSFSV